MQIHETGLLDFHGHHHDIDLGIGQFQLTHQKGEILPMDHALHEHDNIRAGLVRLAELLEQLARFGNPVQQIRGSQRQILGQNRSQDGKKRLIVRDGQKMTLLILHKINDGIFILLLPAPDGASLIAIAVPLLCTRPLLTRAS